MGLSFSVLFSLNRTGRVAEVGRTSSSNGGVASLGVAAKATACEVSEVPGGMRGFFDFRV